MDEIDRWVLFDGPMPTSVRSVLDELRRLQLPSEDDEARAMEAYFATFDERMAREDEDEDGAPLAGDESDDEPDDDDDVLPPPLLALPPAAPTSAAQTEPGPTEPSLSFEAWAELSIRLIGAPAEEKEAAIGARGLTAEAWRRLDDGYLRELSSDLLGGRSERPSLYSAMCHAEMARRQAELEGSPAPAPAPAPVPLPPVVRAPDSLKGTMEAFDIPASIRSAMGKLPFQDPPPVAPRPTVKGSEKTLQVRAMPAHMGQTMPLGDAIEKAVAAVPFTGAAGSPGKVPFPDLTMEQAVSLRAELGMHPPERRMEVLRRYGVPSEASLRALFEHWEREIAQSPKLRAEVAEAEATYRRWLLERGGR